MAAFLGIGNLISGILGGQSARAAGRTIGAAGTAGSTAEGTAGNEAAAATAAATTQATGNITGTAATGANQVNTAGTTAQGQVNTGVANANSTLAGAQNTQTANVNPYLQTGNAGTTALQNDIANPFVAPTAAQAAATPGEQFQMQQGAQLLQQQAAANGGVDTGGEAMALEQYGQGVASTYYQNAFNNSLSAYNTNVGVASGAAGQGLTANAQNNQVIQNSTNQQAANTLGGATYGANTTLGTAEYGSSQNTQAAENAGGLQVAGNETAGNQNLQGTEASANTYLQGAEGTASGQLAQGTDLANGINSAVSAFSPFSGFGLFGSGTNPYGLQGTNLSTPQSGSLYVGAAGTPAAQGYY